MPPRIRLPDRRNTVSAIAQATPMTIDSTATCSVTTAPSSICGSALSAWFQWKV